MALATASLAAAAKVTVSDVPSGQAASFVAGAKPPASAKLRVCRSASYYDNRLISMRMRMGRMMDTNGPQKLEMRINIWQKLDEGHKFVKLKADGLDSWTSSSDSATAYQRDVKLTNVETAARYKARVSFRWVESGDIITWHRTLTTKICKQTVGLPKLNIVHVGTVPVAGSTDLVHTVTVTNTGRSEAVNVPLGINVDGAIAAKGTIDSIGPKQSYDLQLRAPACQQNAYALLDPDGLFARPIKGIAFSWAIPRCS